MVHVIPQLHIRVGLKHKVMGRDRKHGLIDNYKGKALYLAQDWNKLSIYLVYE
jgi:hypothetical protein